MKRGIVDPLQESGWELTHAESFSMRGKKLVTTVIEGKTYCIADCERNGTCGMAITDGRDNWFVESLKSRNFEGSEYYGLFIVRQPKLLRKSLVKRSSIEGLDEFLANNRKNLSPNLWEAFQPA